MLSKENKKKDTVAYKDPRVKNKDKLITFFKLTLLMTLWAIIIPLLEFLPLMTRLVLISLGNSIIILWHISNIKDDNQ